MIVIIIIIDELSEKKVSKTFNHTTYVEDISTEKVFIALISGKRMSN